MIQVCGLPTVACLSHDEATGESTSEWREISNERGRPPQDLGERFRCDWKRHQTWNPEAVRENHRLRVPAMACHHEEWQATQQIEPPVADYMYIEEGMRGSHKEARICSQVCARIWSTHEVLEYP